MEDVQLAENFDDAEQGASQSREAMDQAPRGWPRSGKRSGWDRKRKKERGEKQGGSNRVWWGREGRGRVGGLG